MMITITTFRNGFYAGLLVAVAIGIYLSELWQPDRQIELHSAHFLRAVEQRNWSGVGEFIDPTYTDGWGDDRTSVLARMQGVLSYTRNLRLEPHEAVTFSTAGAGEWRARITATGEENEVMAMIKKRINTLAGPFHLRWQRQSWKPWDWRLMQMTNESLKLSDLGIE